MESIIDETSPPPTSSNNIFCIFYPDTNYLLTTQLKIEFKEYLLQSFLSALSLKEIKDCELSGKKIGNF